MNLNQTAERLDSVEAAERAKPREPENAEYQLRLGEILMSEGLITPEQLRAALKEQKENDNYLGVILMRHKWVNERELARHLSRQRQLDFFELRELEIPSEVLDRIPRELALQYTIMPVAYANGKLLVAMQDPLDEEILRIIQSRLSDVIQPGISARADLLFAINRAYNNLVRSNPHIRDFYDGFAYLLEQSELDVDRIIDLLLALGSLLNASDIHLAFKLEFLRISLRIDGILHTLPIPTRRLKSEHLARLQNKLMTRSGMDYNHRRTPLQGRLELNLESAAIKARISSFPLYNGEKIVMTFLGRLRFRSLEELGLGEVNYKLVKSALYRNSGLYIIAAPDGGGKTTSLYALLSKLPTEGRSVFTIEDPVETDIPFAVQTQVSEEGAITFDAALSQIRRLDAEVIMLSELRSPGIAQQAVDLAMTGRLVLTSLPLENASSVILKLIRMGVEPLALADSLQLILAQRLAPHICLNCRSVHPHSAEYARLFGLAEDIPLYQGAGCEQCYYTGLQDRILIFEIITITDRLREVIASGPTLGDIVECIKQSHGRNYFNDALEKCRQGFIRPEDVAKLGGRV